MASKSRRHFDESAEDIDNLLDLYDAMVALSAEAETFDEGIEVLFRSAVVLMVSHWEAYVEDITTEAVEHLVANIKDAAKLPKQIRQQVAKDVRGAKDELEMWRLADDGWRAYLQRRLLDHTEARNRSFNTPKSQATSEFVRNVLGIEDVKAAWVWDGMSAVAAAEVLDSLVAVRGQVAHRGRVNEMLNRDYVSQHLEFLQKIVSKTGGRINAHLKKVTGSGLW